jgi:hypothetical protein
MLFLNLHTIKIVFLFVCLNILTYSKNLINKYHFFTELNISERIEQVEHEKKDKNKQLQEIKKSKKQQKETSRIKLET